MLGYLSLDIICSSKDHNDCFSKQISSADECLSLFSRQVEATVYKYSEFATKKISLATSGISSRCNELVFVPIFMRTFFEKVTFTANVYYYVTTEFDNSKRDSCLEAYKGVVLQRFEFIKACMGKTVIDIVAEILK